MLELLQDQEVHASFVPLAQTWIVYNSQSFPELCITVSLSLLPWQAEMSLVVT